jgi:hypothetical protein
VNDKIVYLAAFLDRDKADTFRETALEKSKELPFDYFIEEDEIKFINYHWQVRILISPKQMELPIDL